MVSWTMLVCYNKELASCFSKTSIGPNCRHSTSHSRHVSNGSKFPLPRVLDCSRPLPRCTPGYQSIFQENSPSCRRKFKILTYHFAKFEVFAKAQNLALIGTLRVQQMISLKFVADGHEPVGKSAEPTARSTSHFRRVLSPRSGRSPCGWMFESNNQFKIKKRQVHSKEINTNALRNASGVARFEVLDILESSPSRLEYLCHKVDCGRALYVTRVLAT